jgi:hypothetical protein
MGFCQAFMGDEVLFLILFGGSRKKLNKKFMVARKGFIPSEKRCIRPVSGVGCLFLPGEAERSF